MVTGSGGQLGRELQDLAADYSDLEMVFFDRQSFPVEDKAIAAKMIAAFQPDYCINCAAYTAVDLAESERDQAETINGIAVGSLAELCKKQGIKLLHLSTDYVFNGNATAPIKEDHPVAPINFYGATKLMGEQLAMQHNPDCIIIRTSWVYSVYGKNFVKTMMRLMHEKESIGVVADQFGSPTYAADLAAAILDIISFEKWMPGIYHYSNSGGISWHAFATEIKNLIASDCEVKPITTADFPTPAARPGYSVMNTDKIRETFGLEIKNWKDSLSVCVNKLAEGRIF